MTNIDKRALIEHIAVGYDSDHRAVVNSANALNILSSHIYAKEDRFLFELLQNACDSAHESPGGVAVEIALTDGGILRFIHNGRPFNADDVNSLCTIGDSTKSTDEGQIGYKGIGFKSVFRHADRVLVQSGGYGFAFDKEHWHNDKRPWQIMPIWDEPTESAQSTVIELHLRDAQKVQTYLTSLAEHPELVLFLPNLASLRILTGNGDVEIERCGEEGIVTLKQSSAPNLSFLLRHFVTDVPADMREGLSDDPIIPPKIRNMSAAPITFALPLGDDGAPGETVQPVYSYYPTDDNIGLPVSVNSCFLTTASRERIPEDQSWNRHLLKLVAGCLGAWLAELAANPDWRPIMLHILPPKFSGPGSLAGLFQKILEQVLPPLACMPTSTEAGCVAISSTVHDQTGLLSLLGKTTIETKKDGLKHRIHDEVELVEERVGKFNYGLLSLSMKNFESIVSRHSVEISAPDVQVRMVRHLFENARRSPVLKDALWLLDTEGKLGKPGHLFWQPDDLKKDKTQASELRFICSEVQDAARNSDELKDWLEGLGIAPIDSITLVQKVLQPVLKSGSALPDEEHHKWLQIALAAHKKNSLGSDEYQILRLLRVRTKRDQMKPIQECWLGGYYSGDKGWENLVGDRSEFAFIDDNYPSCEDEVEHWKKLFIECGAQSDIKLLTFTESKSRDDIPKDYLNWIDDKEIVESVYMAYKHQHSIRPLYGLNVSSALFADKKIGAKVAQRFFRTFTEESMSAALTATYYVHRNMYTIPSNFSHALETKARWPARDGRCYCAKDLLVVLAPALEELAGTDIPVLDLGTTSFRTEFLRKFGLNTELSMAHCLFFLRRIVSASTAAAPPREIVATLYERMSVLLATGQAGRNKPINVPGELKLLTAAGSFDLPENLYCARNGDDLILFGDHEKAYCASLGSKKAVTLLTALGVNQVRNADISVSANGGTPEDSLTNEISRRAPFFAALSCGKKASQGGYEHELEQFLELISGMRALRVTSYELSDAVHNRSREFRSGCYFDRSHKTLYVTGSWKDPSVMHELAKEIGRLLGAADKAHDIDLLLRLDGTEGRDWLANEGYEIEVTVPHPTPGDSQPEETKESQENSIPDPASIRPPAHRRCTEDDYSPAHDSAAFREQLVALLDAQESPYKGYIYHFTHVENVPSILRDRKIAARAGLRRFLDSAGPGLIAQTTSDVKQFARFYFRPLTPTQWHNEGLGRSVNGIRAFCPVPIFLRISLRSALAAGGNLCAVSNGNLASGYSHFGNSLEFLEFFDANDVYSLFEEVSLSTFMAASQQEFLVHGALDLSRCQVELVCRDEQDRKTLEAVLEDAAIVTSDYPIAVDPNCFHEDAPRLRVVPTSTDEVHLSLVGCRSNVEGAFSIDLSGGDSGAAFRSKGLSLTSDQDISISGTLSGNMRIRYDENGERRLVYAATL